MDFDHLFINLRLLSLDGTSAGTAVSDGCWIGVREGRIAAVGRRDGPRRPQEPGRPEGGEPPPDTEETDLGGRLVTPALVDCHTHLVFAGSRASEWARQLAGESYADIAASGGGIRTTVDATRRASEEELTRSAAERLGVLARDGVGTVEIKSGYGLDRETELRMLRAGRAAGEATGVRVVTTLLAAHAVPPEYEGRPDTYVDQVCVPLIHEAAGEGLADAVDAFCEEIAFTPAQVERVFQAADAAGLPVRLHADQLTDSGGAALAARFGARSADHLEHASRQGVEVMARAGTSAVLLPGAFYHTGETRTPPVTALREAGVPLVVATDANPGSSPLLSLRAAANMACRLFGLTVEESLAGVTWQAARVLDLEGIVGSVAPGCHADLAVWSVESPAELVQWIGSRPLVARIRAGELLPVDGHPDGRPDGHPDGARQA